MITRLYSVMVAIIFVAGAASAQQITVRSGEHSNFTRLVMRLPSETEWDLEQFAGGASLTVGIPQVAFDTTRVFNTIPRTRLSSIGQAAPGGRLALGLDCDCPISTFIAAGNYLVLDIGDPQGIATESERFPKLTTTSSGFISEIDRYSTPSLDLRAMVLPGQTESIDGLVASPSSLPDAETQEVRAAVELPTRDLAYSENVLRQQLGRAAIQGLLDIDELERLNSRSETAASELSESNTPQLHIRAQTSVDRDMALVPSQLSVSSGSSVCVAAKHVDVPGWGNTEETFGRQIGEYRVGLAGEFDNLEKADIVRLSKRYVYFGFGAEAKQLLELVPTQGFGEQILDAMSDILDFGVVEGRNPFQNQEHCNSAVAMWAVLSGSAKDTEEINTTAVLRAFSELPEHLRLNIGPGLLQNFIDLDDSETASLLLRILGRSPLNGIVSIDLVEANLAQLNGDESTAAEKIEEVALGGSENSPEALLQLVEMNFNNRTPLGNDTVGLIETYVLEMRSSDLKTDLESAYAKSLALGSNFRAAFDVAKTLQLKAKQDVVPMLLILLAESADDLTFLDLALEALYSESLIVPISPLKAIARRFLDIGFGDEALGLIDRVRDQEADTDVALMRAEANLLMGQPEQALLDLVGFDGAQADKIRAEALRMRGLHLDAAELFNSQGNVDEASRSEWLAGVPISGGAESDFSRRRSVVENITRPATVSSNVTLTEARELLSQVESLRRDINIITDPGEFERN